MLGTQLVQQIISCEKDPQHLCSTIEKIERPCIFNKIVRRWKEEKVRAVRALKNGSY